MILQQLYRDAREILRQTRDEDLPPIMYDLRPVRWVVELTRDGRALGARKLETDGKKGDRGIPRLVPNVVRTSAVQPILLADKPSYALGIRVADPKKDAGRDAERDHVRTLAEHAAFKEMVRECSDITGDPGVEAVSRFLETWNPEAPSLKLDGLGKDDIITFEVNWERPLDRPSVQSFWASKVRPAPQNGDGTLMQCLVSGQIGPVDKSSAVLIKGIPNGQSSGNAMVSANARAFESYGLERSQTSPICGDASERYARALNALLSSPSHHLIVGQVVYVFWARDGDPQILSFLQRDPDPEKVKNLLRSYQQGKQWTEIDNSEFHCLALSASGSRIVVRSAINTTVGDAGAALAEWFLRLRMVDHEGNEGRPLGLFALAAAPFRKSEDITPETPRALAEAALGRRPLPRSLLVLCVQRCRAEARVTYPRAALMKAILTKDVSLKEAEQMEKESATAQPAAYHCGRLLAELESIQRDAIPGINATITDRYFGAASSAPASVFGPLLTGAQPHLSKLRKERETVYNAHQRRLEEILASIEAFPRTLKLEDQALFSLGYYHHRAGRRAEIALRVVAKSTGAAAPTDAPEGGDDK